MTPAATGWLEAFRDSVGELRATKTKPIVAGSTPEQIAERSILAAHLSAWLDDVAARLPETHAIVLTTSEVGIEAADAVFGRGDPLAASLSRRAIAVRESEYRLWTKHHPDPDRACHVNHWNWIKAPVPEQRHAEFRAWPLEPGEAYWLHRTGTSGPGPAESRQASLWKWTGAHAVLLKPFIADVPPLRARVFFATFPDTSRKRR
jgi:hypothetical protein